MTAPGLSIHATAVVVGESGVVIRGASGAGKSRLALMLLAEARCRGLFARLVGDDRLLLEIAHGRALLRPHPTIAGLLELRTQPFLAVPHLSACVARLVVDLHGPAHPLPRVPEGDHSVLASIGPVALPGLRLPGPPDALTCEAVFRALHRLGTVLAD